MHTNTLKVTFNLRSLLKTLFSGRSADESVGGSRRRSLEQLEAAKKFRENKAALYPGATSEKERVRLERRINRLIGKLLNYDVESLDKQTVLNEFKTTLNESDLEDTEDREHICFYLEEIMDIFQIESSDGLFNKWLYGFDPDEISH